MDIERILEERGIEPLKGRDQFFLQDEEILDFEAGLARLKQGDTVLEIGAGTGNLTRKIAKHANVVAIESDARFLSLLKDIDNADVIIGDALEILQAKKLEFNKIVSNIPYSLSQKILVELLQHKWEIAVLCVQKEFAEKLQEKSKLGIAVNDCCGLTYASDVPAAAFYPEAVDSSIVLLRQRRLLDPAFWQFLDAIYRKKNRNTKNVVKNAPEGLAKKKIHQLSVEELKILFEAYKTLKKG